MSDFKILVVEDDPLHAQAALVYLKQLGYTSIHLTNNAEEAFRLVKAMQPDLMLLDIHILGKMDGVQLAEKIRLTNSVPIIFVTSIRDTETIARASETEPEAYLVKPLEKAALQAAIEISIVRFASNTKATNTSIPNVNWEADLMVRDRIFVKVGNHLKKVQFDELEFIAVSDAKYCSFHTNGRELMVRHSLTELVEKLPPQSFIRVHRAYIINVNFLEDINEKANTLRIGDEDIPIGKTYRPALLERLRTIR